MKICVAESHFKKISFKTLLILYIHQSIDVKIEELSLFNCDQEQDGWCRCPGLESLRHNITTFCSHYLQTK